MRTFINSRAMAMTLALEHLDDEVRQQQHPRSRRVRRPRGARTADRDDR